MRAVGGLLPLPESLSPEPGLQGQSRPPTQPLLTILHLTHVCRWRPRSPGGGWAGEELLEQSLHRTDAGLSRGRPQRLLWGSPVGMVKVAGQVEGQGEGSRGEAGRAKAWGGQRGPGQEGKGQAVSAWLPPAHLVWLP